MMQTETVGNPALASLPDMQQAILDPSTLTQLFRDIELCGERIEVIPKYSAEGYIPAGLITMGEGCALLASGKLRGLQLRYHYDGYDWWDTLMKTPQGIRLVRIRHEF